MAVVSGFAPRGQRDRDRPVRYPAFMFDRLRADLENWWNARAARRRLASLTPSEQDLFHQCFQQLLAKEGDWEMPDRCREIIRRVYGLPPNPPADGGPPGSL